MGAFWFLEALGLLTHSDALPASEFRLPVRLRQTYRCWTQKFRSSWMKVVSAITCLVALTPILWCSTSKCCGTIDASDEVHVRRCVASCWGRITGTTCPTAVPSRRDSTVKPKAEKCQELQLEPNMFWLLTILLELFLGHFLDGKAKKDHKTAHWHDLTHVLFSYCMKCARMHSDLDAWNEVKCVAPFAGKPSTAVCPPGADMQSPEDDEMKSFFTSLKRWISPDLKFCHKLSQAASGASGHIALLRFGGLSWSRSNSTRLSTCGWNLHLHGWFRRDLGFVQIKSKEVKKI